MKRLLAVIAAGLLLAACVQEPVGPAVDKAAAARARVAIATELLRKGDNEQAQVQLKRALKDDPKSPEAHHMMAVLLERDGDTGKADKEYRRAVKLRPEYSQAHNNYGIFLFKNGRYKDAMEQFGLAADDLGYDNRAQAFEGLGRSARRAGDNDAASRAFVRALRLDGSLPMANLEMGEIQYEQGNYDAARAAYQRYLRLTDKVPQSAQSLWLGIRLARQSGDKDALASYELALRRLYPDSPEYKRYADSLTQGQP